MLLISDVHGKYKDYLKIIEGHSSSIQLGDFGFDYSDVPEGHYIIGGNHDNYDKITKEKCYLGDYGLVPFLENTFFIRGAHSIDKQYRIPFVSWWPNEELTHEELTNCIDLYIETKPRIVLSHTCPKSIITQLGGRSDWGSQTETAMNIMFDAHKPEMWIFGHFHTNRTFSVEGTKFICLGELSVMEI